MALLPSLSTNKFELTVPSTNETVEYRPYLVKEEKILMIAAETGNENDMVRAIKDIISSCTFDQVNVEKITMFDLEYIFSKLRCKSVGEKSTVGLQCKECEKSNEVVINLDDIAVSDSNDKKIELTGGVGLMMKYPTVNDISQFTGGSDIDAVFKTIIACIDYIYSGDDVFDAKDHSEKELDTFIGELSSSQFKLIEKFVSGMPSAYVDVEFTCECGFHNEKRVQGLANFFS